MTEDEGSGELNSLFSSLDKAEPPRPARELAREVENTFSRVQEHLPDTDLEHLRWEYLALSLVIRTSIISSEEDASRGSARLTGFLQFENGNTFPDPDSFTETMLDYLAKRAGATANPVVAARFRDIRWERLHDHLDARASIDAYLKSARLFSDSDRNNALLESAVALDCASHIAMQIGDRPRVKGLVKELLCLIRNQTASIRNGRDLRHPPGRWVVEFSRIALYIRDRLGASVVGDQELTEVEDAALELADQNAAADDRWGEQEFLGLAARAAELEGDRETVCLLRLREGESLESEALSRTTGPRPRHLAAAGLYEMALNHYERLRNDHRTPIKHREELLRRVNELKRKIREQYRLGRREMGAISVPFQVPEEELEELLGPLLQPDNLAECLKRVASEGSLLPNLELAEQQARQAAEQRHLIHFIPRTLVVDEIPVAHVPARDRRAENAASGSPEISNEGAKQAIDPAWLASERDRNLLLWITINAAAVLAPLFTRLRERGLNAPALTEYVGSYGFVDENNLEIISVGFERYFADDYVSAIHILALQFEDVIRTLFERAGMPAINRRRGVDGWQLDSNFGAFLRFGEVQAVIPAEIREYIRLVMADPAGWNLRNRVAHGVIDPNQCVGPVLDTVLHLYLILGQFKLEPSNGETSQ